MDRRQPSSVLSIFISFILATSSERTRSNMAPTPAWWALLLWIWGGGAFLEAWIVKCCHPYDHNVMLKDVSVWLSVWLYLSVCLSDTPKAVLLLQLLYFHSVQLYAYRGVSVNACMRELVDMVSREENVNCWDISVSYIVTHSQSLIFKWTLAHHRKVTVLPQSILHDAKQIDSQTTVSPRRKNCWVFMYITDFCR